MTQKHIFLIVLAGLWGFLYKAMTSLQSDHRTQPIRTQRRARPSMIPSGMGALPCADDSKCHLHVCLQVMFYGGCSDTSASTGANTSNTQTHICTHAHKSQTPWDSSICSPYPLESAPKTKLRRDGLRMLFQPFSFHNNLITSDRGDAARSTPGPRSLSAGSMAE